MIDKPVAAAVPPAFSPLARAVIDSVGEGIVVFDSQGRVLFANSAARRVIDGQNGDVRNRLQNLGARFAALKSGAQPLGEAAILAAERQARRDGAPARHQPHHVVAPPQGVRLGRLSHHPVASYLPRA